MQLWFPLRALLTQTSGMSSDEDLSIIRRYAYVCPPFLAVYLFSNVILVHKFSVEEFVQTSNLGEFKRLSHLLAFHGEICDGT